VVFIKDAAYPLLHPIDGMVRCPNEREKEIGDGGRGKQDPAVEQLKDVSQSSSVNAVILTVEKILYQYY
jgi:hypothetical protein